MAEQAEAAGMEVHRVFFPHATWDNVLANIQDANLVVYMGHGYGWPSPYTNVLTESPPGRHGPQHVRRQWPERVHVLRRLEAASESIHLAPNAIVYLNHLCYAAGNGEPGMAIPDVDLARQRVDNMASGWLSIGARAVFAFGWWQKLNYPAALMNTERDHGPAVHDAGDGLIRRFAGGLHELERGALRLAAHAGRNESSRPAQEIRLLPRGHAATST